MSLSDLIYVVGTRIADAIYAYIERKGIADEVARRWRVDVKKSLRQSVRHRLEVLFRQVAMSISERDAYALLYSLLDRVTKIPVESLFPDIDSHLFSRESLARYLHEELYRLVMEMSAKDPVDAMLSAVSNMIANLDRLDERGRCDLFNMLISGMSDPKLESVSTELAVNLLNMLIRNPRYPEICARYLPKSRNLKSQLLTLASYLESVVTAVKDKEVYTRIPADKLGQVVETILNLTSRIDADTQRAQHEPPPAVPPKAPVVEEKMREQDLLQLCKDDSRCRITVGQLLDWLRAISSPGPYYDFLQTFADVPTSRELIKLELAYTVNTVTHAGIDKINVEYRPDNSILVTVGRDAKNVAGLVLRLRGDVVEVRSYVNGVESDTYITNSNLTFLFRDRENIRASQIPYLSTFLQAVTRVGVATNTYTQTGITEAMDTLMVDLMERITPSGFESSYLVQRLSNSAVFVASASTYTVVNCATFKSAEVGGMLLPVTAIACAMPGYIVTSTSLDVYLSPQKAVDILNTHLGRIAGVVEGNVYESVITYVVAKSPHSLKYIYAGFKIHTVDEKSEKQLSQFAKLSYLDVVTAYHVVEPVVKVLNSLVRPNISGTPRDTIQSAMSYRRVVRFYVETPEIIGPGVPTEFELQELARAELELTARRPGVPPVEAMRIGRKLAELQKEFQRTLERGYVYRNLGDTDLAKEMFRQAHTIREKLLDWAEMFATLHSLEHLRSLETRMYLQPETVPPIPPAISATISDVEPALEDRYRRVTRPVYNDITASTVIDNLTDSVRMFGARLLELCPEMHEEYNSGRIVHKYSVGIAEFICTLRDDWFVNVSRFKSTNVLKDFANYLNTLQQRLKTDTARDYANALRAVVEYVARTGRLWTNLLRLLSLIKAVKDQFCGCWQAGSA